MGKGAPRAVPTISFANKHGGHAEFIIGRAFARPGGFAQLQTTNYKLQTQNQQPEETPCPFCKTTSRSSPALLPGSDARSHRVMPGRARKWCCSTSTRRRQA